MPQIPNELTVAPGPGFGRRSTDFPNRPENSPPNTTVSLSVIVPVYNEIKTVASVLKRITEQRSKDKKLQIVVVDDGSTDGTREFLDDHPELYDVFLKNPKNLGKGGAVKNALTAASGDYVLFQDADLEYDPAEYSQLLFPVWAFGADVVMGSRFLAPRWVRVYYFWHKLGNRFITLFFNLAYNTTWTDVYSCYLLFKRDLVPPADLKTTRWQQQAEILGKACLRGKNFYEVPISYHGRSYEEGKKIRWYHVATVLATILRVKILG